MRKIQDPKIKILVTLIYGLILIAGWFTVGIKCIFSLVLGIPCPFCGMTRAFASLIQLDFSAALAHHGMVWSLPILYLLFLYDGKLFQKKHINTIVWSTLAAGFIVNWIFHIFA